jgi:DNA polymerase III epsilon subunit-like protein
MLRLEHRNLMSKYELYGVDTETTGLSANDHSPIEISLYRLSTDEQKTWFIKPINYETISADALRVNKHKLEDLKGLTKYGQDTYRNVSDVLIEIENWVMEDFASSNDRILLGQNVAFDKMMLTSLWGKCSTRETFPFNEKYGIDTMMLQFSFDYAKGEFLEGYNLGSLCKRHGVKNEKSHSATADTKAMVEIFRKQIEICKSFVK